MPYQPFFSILKYFDQTAYVWYNIYSNQLERTTILTAKLTLTHEELDHMCHLFTQLQESIENDFDPNHPEVEDIYRLVKSTNSKLEKSHEFMLSGEQH